MREQHTEFHQGDTVWTQDGWRGLVQDGEMRGSMLWLLVDGRRYGTAWKGWYAANCVELDSDPHVMSSYGRVRAGQ